MMSSHGNLGIISYACRMCSTLYTIFTITAKCTSHSAALTLYREKNFVLERSSSPHVCQKIPRQFPRNRDERFSPFGDKQMCNTSDAFLRKNGCFISVLLSRLRQFSRCVIVEAASAISLIAYIRFFR